MAGRADVTEPSIRPFHLLAYTDAWEQGGAEMTFASLLAALPPQISVTVMGNDPVVIPWIASHRPDARTVLVPAIRDRRDIRSMLRHARMFRRLRPDLIQFNLGMMSCCQWPIFVATARRRCPVIAVENSPVASWSSTSSQLKRWTSPRLAAHLAVGDRTARTIEEVAGLRAGSIRTLYHGVPDVSPRPRPADAPPRIINIARHVEVKGVDVLLEAMRHVDPAVHLIQVGSGPVDLRGLAVEFGVADRVEFREVPWEARAADLIPEADLFVLPSRDEGLPVSIMEAMLAAVPVVATDVGSIREEVVDGETGLLVPKEDPGALAVAINELMADPSRRAEMGRRAREIALERFTIDATVRRYCELYAELLEQRPALRDHAEGLLR